MMVSSLHSACSTASFAIGAGSKDTASWKSINAYEIVSICMQGGRKSEVACGVETTRGRIESGRGHDAVYSLHHA